MHVYNVLMNKTIVDDENGDFFSSRDHAKLGTDRRRMHGDYTSTPQYQVKNADRFHIVH